MLISKRELLDITGISYGQLYRWKREGLIPEEWFIKQSAYTGQETFFSRDLILNRIKAIQELKDVYSLNEVAKILSPEVPFKGFTFHNLENIEEINKEILNALKDDIDEDNIIYIHVLMLIIITALKDELSLSISQVVELYEGIRPYIKNIKSTNYIYNIYEVDKKYYSVLYQEQSNVCVDNRLILVKSIRIEDISNEFKIKYKTQFDYFMADTGEEKELSNENDKEKKLDESETIKISLDDIEIISNKNSSNNRDNNTYEYNNQSSNENKYGNKKNREDDKIVLKFNNWEVRL